jgi:hypothetical protein
MPLSFDEATIHLVALRSAPSPDRPNASSNATRCTPCGRGPPRHASCSPLSTNTDIARVGCRSSASPTTQSSAPASRRTSRDSRCRLCPPSFIIFSLPCRRYSTLLFFILFPLCSLLLYQGFLFGISEVLACAVPRRVEDQSLVVLCLREDLCPGGEQG